MKKTCLILEGGGSRGVYTGGVLDAFLENDILIDDIYGVSAGSLNALSYYSRQKGRNHRMNRIGYLNDAVSYKRILSHKSILDLDYLFNDVNFKLDPLDFEAFQNNLGNFYSVCLDVKTGLPVYKIIESYKDWPYIKASASLPLFTKCVKVDNLTLMDGGVVDPIPLMKAIEDGYEKIIVVLTRDKEFISKPYDLMKLYKIRYRKYPNLIKVMENRHNKYNTTRDLIEKLVKEKKIIAIYPSKELTISHIEKDVNVIDETYNLGYQDGLKQINEIKQYLKGRDNNEKRK